MRIAFVIKMRFHSFAKKRVKFIQKTNVYLTFDTVL